MVVLLDKPLTERQLWVLEYLSGFPVNGPHQWVGAASYFDDEIKFLREYTFKFGLLLRSPPIDCQRSLYRVLMSLRGIGLVEARDTSNHGVIGTNDHGPSHSNQYRITNRGRRALVSRETYDAEPTS